MLKHIAPTVIFLALAFGVVTPSKADIIATIGEYNGTPSFDFDPADYPLASATIGDFTFTIPNGATVLSVTISGTFGNNDISPLTAASDYFIDNGAIEVASCDDGLAGAPCDTTASSPTAWSYTLTSSQLSTLATELAGGSVDFAVIQNAPIAVQTGVTTLDLVVTPEPSLMYLLCGGLAGIALLRRARKA